MKEQKIKFIRGYRGWGGTWYDIVYKSGRVCTRLASDLPSTAYKFIMDSTKQEEQYDTVYKRPEVLYFA